MNGLTCHLRKKKIAAAIFVGLALLAISCVCLSQGSPYAVASGSALQTEIFHATHFPWAAEQSYEEIEYLIKQGEDVNATDRGGRTALHLAVFNNEPDKVDLLLKNGAEVNVMEHSQEPGFNGWGWYPLHLALRNENKEIIKMLVEHGADVNAARGDGWTPLFTAAWHGQVDMIELLVSRGADINKLAGNNYSVLRAAVDAGKFEAAVYFFNHGADPNVANAEGGSTVLHSFAGSGNVEGVKMLLTKAAVDPKDKEGKTPLFFAAEKGYIDVVNLLIAKGADVNAKSTGGISPLQAAIEGEKGFIKQFPGLSIENYTKVKKALTDKGAK